MRSIQIAGTNGKGSTAIYLASILGRSHKTGLYTSPHIRFFEERFILNGRRIDDETLRRLAELEADEDSHLFMVWTRMAKRWMEESGVDYAVVETGLGGAQDPTRIFQPVMEILTPISLDHTELLGATIAEIAREKAGIIGPGTRVFSAPQLPDAMAVIETRCRLQNARLSVLAPGDVRVAKSTLSGQEFSLVRPDWEISGLRISALSPAQTENAALAAMAAHALGAADGDIAGGLARASIPGRAEYLPPGIVMDGGHNPAALRELERMLRHHFPGRSFTVLFALMKEKDAASAAAILERLSHHIYLTQADENRGFPPTDLAAFFREPVETVTDPQKAFDIAWEAARRRGDILVVCGSFYLEGAVWDQVEDICQHRLASTLW